MRVATLSAAILATALGSCSSIAVIEEADETSAVVAWIQPESKLVVRFEDALRLHGGDRALGFVLEGLDRSELRYRLLFGFIDGATWKTKVSVPWDAFVLEGAMPVPLDLDGLGTPPVRAVGRVRYRRLSTNPLRLLVAAPSLLVRFVFVGGFVRPDFLEDPLGTGGS